MASALRSFSTKLAEYYQLHYSRIQTVWKTQKYVKDVWIPLQIEEVVDGDSRSKRPIDHMQMCDSLRLNKRTNKAIVSGESGMGKTTMIKKIAYDWAVKYSQGQTDNFILVLAVPLRYVNTEDFDEELLSIVVGYFMEILQITDVDRYILMTVISQLDYKLLVCLDGFDEYNSSAQLLDTTINFKLLITSVNEQSILETSEYLRFKIGLLDTNHLAQFVQHYSTTDKGLAKVNDFIWTKKLSDMKVPLMLTYACYLADLNEEIPTSISLVVEHVIMQMLLRQMDEQKLEETVDKSNWKGSNLIQAASNLAYYGWTNGQFVFNESHLDKYHVSKDSFTCGFLIKKFDVQKQRKCEFLHSVILEYFAALHAYRNPETAVVT